MYTFTEFYCFLKVKARASEKGISYNNLKLKKHYLSQMNISEFLNKFTSYTSIG